MGHMFKSLMKAPGNGTKRSHGTSTFEALFRHISPLSSSLFVCFFFNSPIDSYLKLWLWCCRWRQPSRGFARHQPFLLEHCFSSILQVSLSCNPSPIYRHSANPKFLPSLWEKRWIWKGDMESCNCKYITAC